MFQRNWRLLQLKENFLKGEIIEVCPIVVLDQRDSYFVEATSLEILCHRFNGKLVVPGGYGSVYFPSEDPNARATVIPEKRALIIKANREIKADEFIYLDRKGLVSLSDAKIEYNKPTLWHSDGLIVKPSTGRGLGTFTTRKFKEGDYVEICHLYTLTERESHFTEETAVNGFMYAWGSKNKLSGWAIGYPCFYNHSEEPNIDPWGKIDSIEDEHLAVRAIRDLEPDTELVFDYQEGCKKKDLGFKAV